MMTGIEGLGVARGGGALSLDYLQLAEIGATAATTLQNIVHDNTNDWDAVSIDAQRVDFSTPTESDIVGSIVVGANEITIGKSGRYEVIVALNGVFDAGPNDFFQLVLNGLAGTVLGVGQNVAAAANTDGSPAVLVWQGDLVVNDTLDVRVDGNNANGTQIQAYSISIKELP